MKKSSYIFTIATVFSIFLRGHGTQAATAQFSGADARNHPCTFTLSADDVSKHVNGFRVSGAFLFQEVENQAKYQFQDNDYLSPPDFQYAEFTQESRSDKVVLRSRKQSDYHKGTISQALEIVGDIAKPSKISYAWSASLGEIVLTKSSIECFFTREP
jgi:hypothetical protein